MKSPRNLHDGGTTSLSDTRPEFELATICSEAAIPTQTDPRTLSRLLIVSSGLLLISTGAAKLSGQGWQQPNPYPQQAPYSQPYAQPRYNQPNYAPPAYGQAAPYAQQPSYSQQPYGQQPYTQAPNPQQYSQAPYSQQPNDQQIYGSQADNYAQDNYGQQQQPTAQPLNAEQLEQLVAPIALYPDALVAQVLAAATYPAQVAAADQWRRAMGNAYPDQIVAGADAQAWDPSVKALTAFPQVLAELDQNLQWTTDLGNAYFNQPQDVLQTIQVMRQRAQSAGTLRSTPQEAVTYDQGYIELAPTNPQTVYVPSYNPWESYGQPVEPYHGFSLSGVLGAVGSFLGSGVGGGLLHFGPGIAMSAFSSTPWGWVGWALNWLTQSVLFNHSDYYSNSTSVAHWNLARGGSYGGGYGGRGNWSRSGEGGNHYPRGDNWAGRGNQRYLPQPGGRTPDRFAGNGRYEPTRPGGISMPERGFGQNPVRPGLPGYRQGELPGNRFEDPRRGGFNRMPEPGRRGYLPGYGNRPGEGNGFRSGGYPAPAPIYRQPVAPARGGFGDRSFEPLRDRGFNGRGFNDRGFKPEKSGGFHPFGGGHKSDFGREQRMPRNFGGERMPKNFGHEKMPKAPHFSDHGHGGGGHSGGGHSGGGHSGGGHLFGGHHH